MPSVRRPRILRAMSTLPPRRDLAHYIRTYDDGLPLDLCQRLLHSYSVLGRFHRRNGRNERAALQDSAWTELDVSTFSDDGFKRGLLGHMHQCLARYNAELGLSIPLPPSDRISEFILKRYQPDGPAGKEGFQTHFDSLGPVCNRYLVFLWYLNDVAEGGATRFVDLDVEVQPKAGRLVMFPPYWMFQHAGLPPVSGDKYILSTYYLF